MKTCGAGKSLLNARKRILNLMTLIETLKLDTSHGVEVKLETALLHKILEVSKMTLNIQSLEDFRKQQLPYSRIIKKLALFSFTMQIAQPS